MTIAKQIEALTKKRGDIITAMETVVKVIEDEGRPLTDEEDERYQGFKGELEGVDKQLKTLTDLESITKTKAVPADPEPNNIIQPWGSGVRSQGKEREKGTLFATMARCMFHGGGNALAASQFAKEVLKDDEVSLVLRATVAPGDTTTSGWASQLVQTATQGFWDLLRGASIYANFPSETATLGANGKVILPGMSAGAAGGFVGEGTPIPVKKATFTSADLMPYKLAVISVVTKELLQQSNPSVDTILRNSMVRDTGIILDKAFVDNTALSAGVRPAGLQTLDGSPTSSGGVTLDKVDADLKTVLAAFVATNADLTRAVWLLNPAQVIGLSFLQTATGTYPYRDMLNAGTLFRIPVMQSTSVTAGVVILVDASSIVRLVGGAPEISSSEDATLHMVDANAAAIGTAGTPNVVAAPARSMFQEGLVALRMLMPASWIAARTGMVQVITGMTI